MSNEGPMFKMLESMLGGAASATKGNEALKKLLKSGIPGLEGFLSGGPDGFAKMSDEDKKRFLAAVTGVGKLRERTFRRELYLNHHDYFRRQN